MNYTELTYKEQKKQLILNVNKFVKHSDMIYKNSSRVTLKTFKMIDKISLIKDRLHSINSFIDLNLICKRIFVMRKDLNEILPNPNNNSYESSLENLNEILTFCSVQIRSKTRQTA